MSKQVTQFDLLISCPSDVKEELEIIKETVDGFNRMYGEANNALIVTRDWSKDSYPELGGSPQELLNKQFVLNCDAAVAVFWTRFGTPTDEYDSGTEEEIEELIKSGKQVFLYFSDCQLNPSIIDPEQYKKIMSFRDKYKNKGIYGTYSSIHEFRKDFLNHLSLYFVKLLAGTKATVNSNISKLTIKGVINGKITDQPIIYKTNYSNSEFIHGIKGSILKMYEEIKGITLPRKIIETTKIEQKEKTIVRNELTSKIGELALSLQKPLNEFARMFPSSKVIINEDFKRVIKKFAQDNNIDNNEDEFFYIGDLTKHQQPSITGQSYRLDGSDDEKRKYELIKEVYWKINEYRQYIEYFSGVDEKHNIELALSNTGTRYDEDVDIRIYIKKGLLCNKEKLPFPGDDIIESVNNVFDAIYKSKKTISVNEYDNYPELSSIPFLPSFGINGPTYEDEVKHNKKEYTNKLETTFCYDYFQDNESDIICYKQGYIKQNTSVFFPTVLVFHTAPDRIRYEISSKYLPEPINGELNILKNS